MTIVHFWDYRPKTVMYIPRKEHFKGREGGVFRFFL